MILTIPSEKLRPVDVDPSGDPVRSSILACLADLGESPEQASIAIGQPSGFLRGYIDHGLPGELPNETRRRLALHLGIPETALL